MISANERSVSNHLFEIMEQVPFLPPGSGIVGVGADGEAVVLNLTERETAHVIVSGEHASGKTSLLRAFATSLALSSRQAEIQLVLIDTDLAGGNDPRGSLQPLSFLPHSLADMIVNVDDALAAFNFLVSECAYRVAQGIRRPDIAVFVDHLLPLLVEGGSPVEEWLQMLLREGADAGIHLVVATRRAELPALEALVCEGWPVRIVSAHSDEEPRADGAEWGEFTARLGRQQTQFDAAYLPDYDLERCLEDLRRSRPPSLIAQPLPAHSLR